MLRLAGLILALAVSLSTAFGPLNTGHFPPDGILQCMVPNPRAGQRDQPDTKPEDVPVIPFHIVYRGDRGSWFQPVPSTRAVSPASGGRFSAELVQSLTAQVGGELNIQLSSIEMPRDIDASDMTTAAMLIPQRIILEGDGIGPRVEGLINRTAEVERRLDELGVTDPDTRLAVLDANDILNRRCNPRGGFEQLMPLGQFFPPWMYASYCPIANCSLPLGMGCEPVVKKEAIAYSLYLMWDCCFSYNLVDEVRGIYNWMYQCGWRRVRLAYVGRCDCACTPQFIEEVPGGGLYINSVGVAERSRP